MANNNIYTTVGAIGTSGTTGLTLTSHGINTQWGQLQPQSIKELLSDINTTQNELVKKYEVLESEEDFLALSVTWHRLRMQRKQGTSSPVSVNNLIDKVLFRHVTEEDRVRANTIRDFYQKKFLMLSLKSKHLTMFRKDLSDYVNGNSKIVAEKMLPMIYRLPEFYDYDIAFDELKRELKTEIPEFRTRNKPVSKMQRVLFPLKCLTKETKRMKCHEYWMHDSTDNLYVIVLDLKNQLQPLWDREFSKQSITIEGFLMPKSRDDIEYYQLGDWTVV